MTKTMTANWHLRKLMALKGIFNTSDLAPLLAERGIQLSRSHIYRIVTETPQYLSLDVLAALCDILNCTPNDLIEPIARKTKISKAIGQDEIRVDPTTARKLRAVRARIKDADKD
jgi:DNA-binding Xre family transcriptional regulator